MRKGMSDEIFRRDSPGGVTDPCFLADEKFGKRVRLRDGGEEPGGFSMHDLQCKESDLVEVDRYSTRGIVPLLTTF